MQKRTEDLADEFTPEGEPLAVDTLLAAPSESSFADEPLCAPCEEDYAEALLDLPARRGRREPLTTSDAPVSVYTRLVEFELLRKLTDIVLAKVSVPWHLREDAAQEVHVTWASLTAKPNFARNQLARYAYLSGQHAALKLRRNIGAVVTIPGALFRTGRDTAFMEAIGAAVNPKDVEDYKDSLELSVDALEYAMPPQSLTVDYLKTRLAGLTLSKSQRTIAEYVLVKRMSAESIAQVLEVRVSYVERLINQVAQMLYDKDDAELFGRGEPNSED